jgi:hypothetical protein
MWLFLRRVRRAESDRRRNPRSMRLESLEARSLLAADVILSEILAVNDDGIIDEDGDHSDWIELYNRGDETADLTAWTLTDDAAEPAKWAFPAQTLAPEARLLVFASDKNRAVAGSQLHTNFKLAGDGDYLALANSTGTIVSAFEPGYPHQRKDVSYGWAAEELTTALVGPSAPAKYLVPTAAIDAQIGQTWADGAPFDDSAWQDATGGIGYDVATASVTMPGTPAYRIGAGATGNQAFTGALGMDFVVARPITITSLGAFDDGSNGMSRTITVQLWSRDDRGTPNQFADDRGGTNLAALTFTTASPGTLVGGSRFKALASPLTLQPGSYSIVAFGYGSAERNGNSGDAAAFGTLASTDALSFVGSSRFSPGGSTAFPTSIDLGPANRYGAGTFAFVDPDAPPVVAPPAAESYVGYRTAPGVGTHTFAGNLGMDFNVARPIRVTELGVFDSGQDGIQGALGASLWRRNADGTGTELASLDFFAGDGALEAGTGSRFLPLETPLLLQPGQYTINASGFVGQDFYSHAADEAPLNGTTDGAVDAVQFVGTARYSTDPNRFIFEPFHRFPDRTDVGPFNKWAAGTFKYELPIGDLYDVDAATDLYNVNASAYVRIPFNVTNGAAFDELRLLAQYDDGFVAYLNGQEIARRNAPDTLAWNSPATAERTNLDVFSTEVIDVSEFLPLLHEGDNLLAIQGLNAGAGNGDFASHFELNGISAGAESLRYFTMPTPEEPNRGGVTGVVEDTHFSIDRGIIGQDQRDAAGQIHVEITTPTAGAQIYYTVDGTEPTVEHGILYTGAIDIGTTTTLRAAAFQDGFLPTDVDTHSYLFLDDVANQSSTPGNLPPHWNGEIADYGMTADPVDRGVIANDPSATPEQYEQVIEDSLLSLPTLSIVLDPKDMFGPADGLYSNTYPRGDDWERAASVEYILPDGSEGFQVNAALQMMGWTSRIPGVSPKHTMRVVFKDDFGPGRLSYKYFPDLDVDSFNSIALRANSRDTWVSDNGGIQGANGRETRPTASYIRDEWARETYAAMGQPIVDGSFVQLYINGVYWGLYNTTERPDAAYAEEHFGGSEEDYDVLRFCNPAPQLVDGSFDKYNELVALVDQGVTSVDAYEKLQGNNPDGTRNPAYEKLLDVDSLIDFMINGYYHAASDWPCNWYAIRDRRDTSEGFKFLQWDNDLAFPFGDLSASTVTPQSFWASTPGRFDMALRDNPEYRMEFADRVQKHFFNGGALTPEKTAALWDKIGQEVRPALAAEAARWGDYRRDVDPTTGGRTLYTAETYWDPFNEYMLDTYFPARSGIVLDQLRAAGLFPSVSAPELSQNGGEVAPGYALGITAAAGTVYYTTDGSDPRAPASGEIVSSTLVAESAPKRALVPSIANSGNTLGGSWRGGAEPFDDSSWSFGTGGVGYDTNPSPVNYAPYIGVNTQEMLNTNGSVLVRIPFDVTGDLLATLNQLTLRLRFDDGFVAFLNGQQIAAANAPSNLAYNAVATAVQSDSAAILFQDFDVTQFLPLLHEGTNMLAIQGLNQSAGSSDLLISAELDAANIDNGDPSPTAQIYSGPIVLPTSTTVKARAFANGQWSALTEAQFSVANPLRVVELMYNPPGSSEDGEFVEIVNTGPTAVSLVGVHFAQTDGQGIDYEFLADDVITSLAAGERIVVAKNREAFVASTPNVANILLADREYTGSLDNAGEQITLLDADGGAIQQFTYDDAWQPTTDGDGRSLVIIDESAAKATWNDAASWRASLEQGGSPGEADAMAGDVNGDDGVDWADFVIVQQNLGLVSSEDRRVTRADGDVNGDGRVSPVDLYALSQRLWTSYAPPAPAIATTRGSASGGALGATTSTANSALTVPATGLPGTNPPGTVTAIGGGATIVVGANGVPSYVPPAPTNGYSQIIDELVSSLPAGAGEMPSLTVTGMPAAAPPAIVTRKTSGAAVPAVGGATTPLTVLGGSSGGAAAVAAPAAAALVDRVHRESGATLLAVRRVRGQRATAAVEIDADAPAAPSLAGRRSRSLLRTIWRDAD